MHRAFRATSLVLAAAALTGLLFACDPDDGAPSEPIPTIDAGVAPAAKAALGDPCKIPSDCASEQCFVGGQFSYCSLKCGTNTAATVCAPPIFNGVCNKQGFCRKP